MRFLSPDAKGKELLKHRGWQVTVEGVLVDFVDEGEKMLAIQVTSCEVLWNSAKDEGEKEAADRNSSSRLLSGAAHSPGAASRMRLPPARRSGAAATGGRPGATCGTA